MPDQLRYWEMPHGYSIFCDDIRNEVGGKTSFMGVYNSILYSAAPFPTSIRLSFFVSYREPMQLESKPVRLVITYAPDEGEIISVLEADMDAKLARDHSNAVLHTGDDPRNLELAIGGTFHQLLIEGPGRLKVRAYRDAEEVRLGTLRIEGAPAEVIERPTPAPE